MYICMYIFMYIFIVEMEIDQPDLIDDSQNHKKPDHVIEETVTTSLDKTSFKAYGISISAEDIASLTPFEMINDNMVTVFFRYVLLVYCYNKLTTHTSKMCQ